MGYMKDEQLRRMTDGQLADELHDIEMARALLDQNRRLLLIKRTALENRMEQSDPLGPEYERLEKKWREIDDELDQSVLDDLELRHNLTAIDYEVDRRRVADFRNTRGW